MTKRFEVGDLVQIKSEYLEGGNPSLFRIREIVGTEARLGQLSSSQYDGYIGADTWIDVEDSELIDPYPEILQRYALTLGHIRERTPATETVTIAVLMGFSTAPADVDDDAQELYRQCDAASFALRLEDLPYGGWTNQGMAFERAATITVPVESPEAQSAIANMRSGPA